MAYKTTVLKSAPLPIPDTHPLIFHFQGNIFMVSNATGILYMLKYNLEIIRQIDLKNPKDNLLKIIDIIFINNYPHLVIFPQNNKADDPRGYLVKFPTRYNREILCFPITNLPEWYDMLSFNDEITSTGSLDIKGIKITEEEVIFYNEDPDNLSLLSIEKDEFIEFVQGHSGSVPFPRVMRESLKNNINSISYYQGITAVLYKVDHNSILGIEEQKQCFMENLDVKVETLSLYEKDGNALIALGIANKELQMLQIEKTR